jgi:hypothetical protein
VSHSFLVLEPTGMRAVKLRWLPEMDEPKWSEQTFIDQWPDRPHKVYRADPSTYGQKRLHTKTWIWAKAGVGQETKVIRLLNNKQFKL